MHTLRKKQHTTRYPSAEGEFEFHSTRSRENKTRMHLPQTTVRLFIGGEGAVADVAEGVAGLQFGFLAV